VTGDFPQLARTTCLSVFKTRRGAKLALNLSAKRPWPSARFPVGYMEVDPWFSAKSHPIF